LRNKVGAVFRQSLTDFPCSVVLGKKSPSFGLHRYKQGLQFLPLDDDGYTMRGDKRRLLYQGRRRSHRFTILGDTSFEYDCILHKEPESNVVSLLIDGAEHFDFFRQPDFIKDPYLKGSYAVYKKITMIGEGTGKLCHIHRPLIIDARGRRVWGTLAVVGNMLHIIIPENWLGEAKYPVIVDPVVGNTVVGAHSGYYEEEYQEDYIDEDGDWVEFQNDYLPLGFDEGMAHNRYRIFQDFYGTATAYVYLSMHKYILWGWGINRYVNNNLTIKPCIYSDNNNQPLNRLSMNEGLFDHEVNQTTKIEGWRSAPFTTNQVIDAGTYVWFGVNFLEYQPHFDYAAKSYICYVDYVGNIFPIPDIYPMEDCYDTYDIVNIDNIKISMYFNFTPMEHYVRTLTQGVRLTDTRKLTGNYKRSVTETAKINSVLSRFETILIKVLTTVNNTMSIKHLPSFVRKVIENITVTMANRANRSITRKCRDDVNFNTTILRKYGAMCIVKDILLSSDKPSVSLMYLRSVSDNVQLTHHLRRWWAIIRSLLDNVENTAGTTHKGEFYRFNKDTLQAAGVVVRSLSMFVRIVSKILIHDYILGRFLRTSEELKLKSAICREIILESKID